MRLALALLCALAATANARTATGYQGGHEVKLKIVDVGGAEAEVHTAKAYRAMAKAAHKAGVSLSIRSGYRTHAKQKKLYKQYRRGEGNLAAKPGFSQHENGRALDLVITQEKTYLWLIAHANQFGFHRTVRGEPWHWEYLGGNDQTAVERGVSSRPAASASNEDDYGEHPCTRDWGYARPLMVAPEDAPESEDAGEQPPDAPVAPAPEPCRECRVLRGFARARADNRVRWQSATRHSACWRAAHAQRRPVCPGDRL